MEVEEGKRVKVCIKYVCLPYKRLSITAVSQHPCLLGRGRERMGTQAVPFSAGTGHLELRRRGLLSPNKGEMGCETSLGSWDCLECGCKVIYASHMRTKPL